MRTSFISQFQGDAEAVSFVEPMTIRPLQNAGWRDGFAADVTDVRREARGIQTAKFGDRIRSMRAAYQQDADAQSQEKILTTVLQGIRRSGSGARVARVRGLGNVDCTVVPPSTWQGPQGDAFAALLLSNMGLPEAPANLAATGAGTCYTQFLASVYPVVTDDDKSHARAILAVLRSNGAYANLTDEQVLPALSILRHVHRLTPERALELYECGVQITKSGGWGRYGELWQTTPCGASAWYENPWYLGAGATVLIGAVWFATRKKRK